MKKQKLLASILASPHNVSFSDAKKLVIAFGFRLVRIKGIIIFSFMTKSTRSSICNLLKANRKLTSYVSS